MTRAGDQFFGSLRVERTQVWITVAGEIDDATVERFGALVEAAFAVDPTHLEVDMAGVEYVGLCAVPVLEQAATRLAVLGAGLALRNVPHGARKLFDAAGLTASIDVEYADSDAAVVRRLGATMGVPPDRAVLDAALTLVVRMAQAVVKGADGVSITLPRQGGLGTVAASNRVVLEMDHDQYDTGQGPCLDAATQGERFHIDSLDDETRWPEFVPRARARGIESILSTPLVTHGRATGALNVYSRRSRAFASHEKEWADQFAAEASVVVATATTPRAEPFAADLADALQSRHVIAMAQGILLDRNGNSPAAAYDVLRDASRQTGKPLRELCEELVSARTEISPGARHAG